MGTGLQNAGSVRSGRRLVIVHALGLVVAGVAVMISAADPKPDRLGPPDVGDVRLRVLSPTTLEVETIRSVAEAGAADAIVDLGRGGGPVTVVVDDRAVDVSRRGIRRRVRYAPLRRRDLRVSSSLYLELSQVIESGSRVSVTLAVTPGGEPRALVARADDDRLSPAIHVSQAGYMPGLPKRVQVGYYLGTLGELRIDARRFEVRRLIDNVPVLRGALAERPDQGFRGTPPPYQRVLEARLDDLDRPGVYRVFVEGIGTSAPFRIGPTVPALLARTYALGLYHQRCGDGTNVPFTRFVHDACHLAPAALPASAEASVSARLAGATGNVPRNQNHTAPRLDRVSAGLYPVVRRTPVDVRGGHHDAGDYGKYAINSARLVHALLFAGDALPGVVSLDNLGLPESNDGVSDVLQIARREADFLVKLQDDDGGFFFLVQPRSRPYETDVLPDRGDPQVVFPKNTSATAAATAALAQAASSPAFRRAFPAEAARYLVAARRGWAFLQQAWKRHGRQGAYQTVTHYGDVFEDRDEIAWAATEMFLATGDEQAHDLVRRELRLSDPSLRRWGWWRLFEGYGAAARAYAFAARTGRVPHASLDEALLSSCEREILAAAQDHVSASRASAYGTSYPDQGKRANLAGWYFGEDAAFDLAVAYQLEPRGDFLEALVANLSYATGANPVNVSYVAGLGSVRPVEVVHQYAQNDRRVLPPTGLLFGNLQQGLPSIGWYKGELRALTIPPDANATGVYPMYDRWSDVFNTMSESVSVNIAHGLAATTWLMARSPLAAQRWRSADAEITVESSGAGGRERRARVAAKVLNLAEATVTWETDVDGAWASGPQAAIDAHATWVEAEALLPDGRRAFAVRDLRGVR